MTISTDSFQALPVGEIKDDLKSHTKALEKLKEGYELITRQRGNKGSWAVTFADLVAMGVITEETANERLAQRRGV